MVPFSFAKTIELEEIPTAAKLEDSTTKEFVIADAISA